jgi:hypothetical protein
MVVTVAVGRSQCLAITTASGGLDLSVKDSNGYWSTDLAFNGFNGWDNVPGTSSTSIHNPSRQLVNYNHPWIEWTKIYEPDEDRNGDGVFDDSEVRAAPFVNGHYQLKIGVRYTAAVRIMNGVPPWDKAGVAVNPDLHVPASLNLVNPVASTGHIPIDYSRYPDGHHTRRFAVTCSEWGSYPLGFMMVGPTTLNPDYGIRVACTSTHPGLYGIVRRRQRDPSTGRYYAGSSIAGATVTVAGYPDVTADTTGHWSMPSVTGGAHRVVVTKGGYSGTIAVNVRVPAFPAGMAGVEVNTPLEESFNATLGLAGMLYTTYIDYSRGRTILHTVRIDSRYASVKLNKSDTTLQEYPAGSGKYIHVFKKLTDLA